MDIKKKFGVDKNKVLNGVPIKIDIDGTTIVVARSNNDKYKKVFSAKIRDRGTELRTTVLSNEEIEKLQIEAEAETVLVGWKGIQEAGVDVPYTIPTAIKMLTDYPDFHELVLEQASRLENFLEQQEGQIEKNSVVSLPGN